MDRHVRPRPDALPGFGMGRRGGGAGPRQARAAVVGLQAIRSRSSVAAETVNAETVKTTLGLIGSGAVFPHAVATGICGGHQMVATDMNKNGKVDLIPLGSQMTDLMCYENP